MGKVKDSMMKSKGSAAKTGGIVKRGSDGGLRERRQAAIQAMAQRGFDAIATGANTIQLEESGLVDKADLEGVPFAVVDVQVRDGDFGPYVSVTAILKTNEVVIFNDGSTGIARQLEGLEISPETPLMVRGGLRASHYTGPNGAPATTYYLSGRKPKDEIAGVTKGGTANGTRQARAAF